MKNKKSRTVEAPLLPLVDQFFEEDTRTYEQLCKDARTAIERTAEVWIPLFCNALHRQYPLLKYTEIKTKVIDDWSRLWKEKTIREHWPDWIKNPKKVEAGEQGGRPKGSTKTKTNDQFAFFEKSKTNQNDTNQSQQSQEPEESQATKDARKHHTLIQNIYGYEMGLTEFLTGYKEDQIISLNDNLKLTSETKNYRFDLTKRLAELDLKAVYRESRRLALVLNDFLKQLDNELGSRKKKQALTSE